MKILAILAVFIVLLPKEEKFLRGFILNMDDLWQPFGFSGVARRHFLYIILQHKQIHGIFQPYQSWRPHACLCPARITWLLLPRSKNQIVLECSQIDDWFYPVVPSWTQQYQFISPVCSSTWVEVVSFHMQLLPAYFPSQKQLVICWREHTQN